jgi:hypothetical protein
MQRQGHASVRRRQGKGTARVGGLPGKQSQDSSSFLNGLWNNIKYQKAEYATAIKLG